MNIFVRSLFCLPWMILINIQFSNDCFWLFCLALPLIFWSDSFQRFSVILEIPPLYDEFLQWNARGKWEWVNWKQTNSIAESHSQFFFFFLPQHVARGASLIKDRICTPPPSTVEAGGLNLWTTWEVPHQHSFERKKSDTKLWFLYDSNRKTGLDIRSQNGGIPWGSTD